MQEEERASSAFGYEKSLDCWKNNPRFQFACGQPVRQRTDQFLFIFHVQRQPRTPSVRQEKPSLPMIKLRLRLDAVRFDLIVESLSSDSEALGGFELVTARLFQHLNNGIALDSFQESEIGI